MDEKLPGKWFFVAQPLRVTLRFIEPASDRFQRRTPPRGIHYDIRMLKLRKPVFEDVLLRKSIHQGLAESFYRVGLFPFAPFLAQ
jgi:hypothetical protein